MSGNAGPGPRGWAAEGPPSSTSAARTRWCASSVTGSSSRYIHTRHMTWNFRGIAHPARLDKMDATHLSSVQCPWPVLLHVHCMLLPHAWALDYVSGSLLPPGTPPTLKKTPLRRRPPPAWARAMRAQPTRAAYLHTWCITVAQRGSGDCSHGVVAGFACWRGEGCGAEGEVPHASQEPA